jgi:chromosome segregation ATPase
MDDRRQAENNGGNVRLDDWTRIRAGPGIHTDMGDSAEFEKLSALETRLASALDRIAKRIAVRDVAGEVVAGDAALDAERSRADAAEAAKAEAEARARELADRVAALEARLGEAQEAQAAAEAKLAEPPVSNEADVARIADLEGRLSAREADLADLTSARDALVKRVEELEEAAQAQSEERGRADELDREIAVLKRRVERARQERDEARTARDAAQDLADELAEAGGSEPDDRVLALRGELRRLQAAVDELSRGLDALRSGTDDADINEALAAQVAALTEARRAEAAELNRILSDLGANDEAAQGGAGHA